MTATGQQDAGHAGLIGACPDLVRRPVMAQRWERLTFLHWPYDASLVQSLLPARLRVEEFGGSAWVGLVPFFMHVASPGGREAPWASAFCETNVRTYVRDESGRAGVWFLSLEASRLGAVAVARTAYSLPYYWSAMRLAQRGDVISYGCRRRWPGPAGTRSRIRIRVGEPISPAEVSERDQFLTARWTVFSAAGTRYRSARVSHEPWPLHHGKLLDLDDGLIPAAGLPAPQGDPLVLYSPGVHVSIGRPERAR